MSELAQIIWRASRADESTISATGANVVADAVVLAGYHKDIAPNSPLNKVLDTLREVYRSYGRRGPEAEAIFAACHLLSMHETALKQREDDLSKALGERLAMEKRAVLAETAFENLKAEQQETS
jgi:hypothetical protein